MNPTVIASLYKFVALEDFRTLREPLLQACLGAGTRGTLLLAPEGINGTLAGTRQAIDEVLAYLRRDPRLADIAPTESHDSRQPFHRMKVKLKREIVTMGVPGVEPRRRVGTYVAPRDWNALLDDPEVLLIDTRNDYECGIGSFRGALDPQTTNFREFPEFVRNHLDPRQHRKVAMFCTGGIRCEKASAYMLEQGFEEVYHLQGGILRYLEEVPEEESRWRGECFVFDDRVAVNHRLERGRYDQCYGCRRPITAQDKRSPDYEKGVCCPYCKHSQTPDQKARFRERQRQMELAARRGTVHVGAAPVQRQPGQPETTQPPRRRASSSWRKAVTGT